MSRSVSQLSFSVASRPFVKLDGASKSERTYIDFLVDGASLGEHFRKLGYDLVSAMTREFLSSERNKATQRLLLVEPPDCPDGRSTLYVCAECADLGCGAVTVCVERADYKIVWRDFDYENDYEPRYNDKNLAILGPFEFDASQYDETIRLALETIDKQP